MNESELLADLMRKSTIPKDSYLLWAKNHYHIPVLSAEYFFQLNSLQFWSEVKNSYAWTRYCLPVAKWDGHWIVAGLVKPENIPANLKVIFVLTSPQNLESLWSRFTSLAEDKTQVIASENSLNEAATQLVALSLNPTASTPAPASPKPAATQASEFSFELVDEESSSEEKSSDENNELIQLDDEAGPAGMFDVGGPAKTELTLISSQDAVPAAEPTLILSNPQITDVPTKILNTEDLKIPEITIIQAPSKTAEPAASSFKAENTGKHFGAINTQLILDILFQKNKTAFDMEIKNVFAKMKSYFPESFVLSLDVEESKMRPYQWTAGIQAPVLENNAVYLAEPSLFKIVNVSLKPYHGYVVVNDINEKFFEIWNGGTVPGHVTATPLMINNKMAGVLMGVGEKSLYSWAVLQFMENLTSELNQKLSSLVDNAA